jgi:hypothetical protein
MLRNTHELNGFALRASDGLIGHVEDFYFDDETWVVRYLVVKTGTWLSGRRVLIAPAAAGQPHWTEKELPLALTKAQIEASPDIDTALPVSRQQEARYLAYYGYPLYWDGSGLAGGYVSSLPLPPAYRDTELAARKGDAHLRSCNAVSGYGIHASDGEIGHVSGLLVDDESWAVRYLVVGTGNWWAGHDVLVAPYWIEQIHFESSSVSVDLERAAIRNAPAYDPSMRIDRAHEAGLFSHYGRAGYWAPRASLEGRPAAH